MQLATIANPWGLITVFNFGRTLRQTSLALACLDISEFLFHKQLKCKVILSFKPMLADIFGYLIIINGKLISKQLPIYASCRYGATLAFIWSCVAISTDS